MLLCVQKAPQPVETNSRRSTLSMRRPIDEVARQLRQRWPALKVLYLSGHTDRLFAERITLWEGEAFLDKPCEVKALLEAASLLMFERVATAGTPGPGDAPQRPQPWDSMTKRDDWSPSRD